MVWAQHVSQRQHASRGGLQYLGVIDLDGVQAWIQKGRAGLASIEVVPPCTKPCRLRSQFVVLAPFPAKRHEAASGFLVFGFDD